MLNVHSSRQKISSIDQPSRSHGLQKLLEFCAAKNCFCLPQCFYFLVARGLTKVKIFQNEIAALMQLCVVIGQLLQLQHNRLLGFFRFNQVCLGLCLQLGLVDNFFALGLNGGVCLLNKVFVSFLRILFGADRFCLHGFGIANDLLNHAHDTTACSVLLVSLESWRWRWSDRFLLLKQGCLLLAIELTQDVESCLQQLLCFALVRNSHLEFFVFLLAILTSTLQLNLHL